VRLRSFHPDPFHPVASPVAHSIAGFWTFLLFAARSKMRLIAACRRYLPQLILLVLLANLPDIDFLFGLGGRANWDALHHGFTHSFVAAFVVALAVTCVWRIAGSFWRSFTVCLLAYSSHLVIDFFTGTKLGWNSAGSGIPLFWPWNKDFSSPLVLVVGVKHKDFPALFSVQNLHSSLYELVIFGVITTALLVLWVRHQENRAMPHRPEQRRGLSATPIQSNERIP
jgi:inner membrane protein